MCAHGPTTRNEIERKANWITADGAVREGRKDADDDEEDNDDGFTVRGNVEESPGMKGEEPRGLGYSRSSQPRDTWGMTFCVVSRTKKKKTLSCLLFFFFLLLLLEHKNNNNKVLGRKASLLLLLLLLLILLFMFF